MHQRRNQDEARLLIRRRGVGMLATAMADDGSPYASLVTYACDHRGQPLFLFSTLSDHTKNLAADKRVSLLVEQASNNRNPQTGPRVSLLGTMIRDNASAVRARFLARHPDAALYADFGDFAFYRMKVERTHYVGGFARAIWYDAKHILTPRKVADNMASAEAGIVAHMNEDHTRAVREYAEHLKGRKAGDWRLTGCDADGIDLRADGRSARLDFPIPVEDSKGCRNALIALARQARS